MSYKYKVLQLQCNLISHTHDSKGNKLTKIQCNQNRGGFKMHISSMELFS